MRGRPRRQFMQLLAGAGACLAGCTGDGASGELTPADGAAGEAPAEIADEQIVERVPDCQGGDVSRVFSVIPLGVTIRTEHRATAGDLRDTIRDRLPSKVRDVDVKPWGLEEDGGFAVEIRRGSITGSAPELRELLEASETDWTWRFGLSLRTNVELLGEVRSGLNRYDGIDVGLGAFRVVVPEPTDPVRIAALLSAQQSAEPFETASRFEIRLVPEGGNASVLGASDVTSAKRITFADERPGVQVALSDAGASRLSEFVDGQPEAYLTRARERGPIEVYLGEERLWAGSISRQLLRDIEAGEWANEFVFTVGSPEQADDLASALGVMELSVPAETGIAFC